MILTCFMVLSHCFYNSPIIFWGRICWAISIEASIFQFLLILWNSSKKYNLSVIGCKGMSISGRGSVGWFCFDFTPPSFLIFVEELLDAVIQRAGAGDSAVDVDGVVVLAVGHVVAWTAGRVVDVWWEDFGADFLVDGDVVPWFGWLGDVHVTVL